MDNSLSIAEVKALLGNGLRNAEKVKDILSSRVVHEMAVTEQDYYNICALLLAFSNQAMLAEAWFEKYGRATPHSKYFVPKMGSQCIVCHEPLTEAHKHSVEEVSKQNLKVE